ncbi:hypothetical protein GCM10010994_28980 [Chelatococcus reniformis]|uniref:Uncharacterized protein n=1 Tax=Chelatococcus reniformis TaxID=1494448 RepID=A0A916UDT8_9HYPH|nr:hypothetical protein GCM10010994_28980 [Chelatococcus reniformis]
MGSMKHSVVLVVSALACLAPVMAGAADKLPTLARETPYSEARASLLALGWQPAAPADGELKCTIGREDVCDAFPETKSCSGTGLARCTFWWRKNNTLVEVGTVGEDVPELSVDRFSCRAGCP